jgi:hypothetical protein
MAARRKHLSSGLGAGRQAPDVDQQRSQFETGGERSVTVGLGGDLLTAAVVGSGGRMRYVAAHDGAVWGVLRWGESPEPHEGRLVRLEGGADLELDGFAGAALSLSG